MRESLMTKKYLHSSISFILAVFMLLAATGTYATEKADTFSTYFASHEKGWHWYDDPNRQTEDESDSGSENNSEMDEMTAVQTAIHKALNKAVLHPTTTNVRNY